MHQTHRGFGAQDSHTEDWETTVEEVEVEEGDHQEQRDPEETQTAKAMVQS